MRTWQMLFIVPRPEFPRVQVQHNLWVIYTAEHHRVQNLSTHWSGSRSWINMDKIWKCRRVQSQNWAATGTAALDTLVLLQLT